MADNVAITAGAGTTVATDDAGSAHYQRVKLTDGTADSTAVIPGDATNGLWVNIKAAVSQAVTIDAAAVTSLALIDDTIFADDAGFTVTSSKVSAVGFMLDDTSTDSVDEGDVGVARMTADRRQLVQLGESGAKDVVGGGSQTGTSDQSIMAALASNYNYLCWLTVYNSSATNTFATLKDGSTTRAIIPLPAYGGAVLQWPRGLRSTSNTAWNVAAGASVTTAYFYGGGFTSTS
jgi:hypothetical protein